MPDLVVLYEVDEAGEPHAVVSSGDAEVVAAVAKLLGAKLGLTAPARVLELRRGTPEGAG